MHYMDTMVKNPSAKQNRVRGSEVGEGILHMYSPRLSGSTRLASIPSASG